MKLLATSKLLCALLAVATVGMGVQTYYLIQVHRQLDAARESDAAQVDGDQSAVVPTDPRAELDRAEDRMRSLFDDFYQRFDSNFGDHWFGGGPLFADGDSFFLGETGRFGPRVDLQDRGDHYELTIDVPGADETAVVVRAEDDLLIVEGSRDSTTEESQPGIYVRRERQFGRFERRLSLPQDADTATLQTEFANGVVKVTLRKQS